ncbi:MAG: hypothetical protein WC479_03035 [Candidatus Izemoplasmatales bacterium]
MGALADILVSKGGYNKTDALNAEKGPRAAELAREFGVTMADLNGSGDPTYDAILSELIRIDDEINKNAPYLTDQEKEIFLSKAVELVTPYYDKKKAEIEAGIKEGKTQDMENLLLNIRDIEENTKNLLAEFDITTAQTNEELANKLADITSTKDEDLTLKADDWRQRIEQKKTSQIQGDTLTSGVGRKQIQDLFARQATEQQIIQRKAGVQTTVAQTSAKYTLEQTALARQNAEQARVNKIGTPAQKAELEAKAKAELGLTGDLPSSAEVLRARTERNITTQGMTPGALVESEEKRNQAIESKKLTLEENERNARIIRAEELRKQAIRVSGNSNLYST